MRSAADNPGVCHWEAVLGRAAAAKVVGRRGQQSSRWLGRGVGALWAAVGARRRSRRSPDLGWIACPQTLEQEAEPLPTCVRAIDQAVAARMIKAEPDF